MLPPSNETSKENKHSVPLAVEKWFNFGLNVLPTKGKKPLVNSWRHWQFTRQTRADIESMQWQSANGFAVICGTETTVTCNNETKKVYLGIIDINHKDTFDFSVFPQTYIEKSPNGVYIYYWSQSPPDATKHDGFELLGRGNYVCVYEQPYNNLPITPTYDITTEFENTCQQLGIANTEKESKLTSKPKSNHTELLNKDTVEGQRDNTAIRLASKLRIDKKPKTKPYPYYVIGARNIAIHR